MFYRGFVLGSDSGFCKGVFFYRTQKIAEWAKLLRLLLVKPVANIIPKKQQKLK